MMMLHMLRFRKGIAREYLLAMIIGGILLVVAVLFLALLKGEGGSLAANISNILKYGGVR